MKLFSIIFLLTNLYLSAQTADEIISKAENLIKGKSAHGTIIMTITTPYYTRELEMESWWVGNEKALIVTKSPKNDYKNPSFNDASVLERF